MQLLKLPLLAILAVLAIMNSMLGGVLDPVLEPQPAQRRRLG